MLTWEKITHFALSCCCLVGSKLCSTSRGNLILLPLKLNSYIRLSTLKLQEGIRQWALIIHILSLLPPFSLLVFLQVMESRVVLCVMQIFSFSAGISHDLTPLSRWKLLLQWDLRCFRDLAEGEITHTGILGQQCTFLHFWLCSAASGKVFARVGGAFIPIWI